MTRDYLLFCRCFGIGNALMAVPAIRHYASNGFDVDVLVGTTPDDGGAYEVLSAVRNWPRSPPDDAYARDHDGHVRVVRDVELDPDLRWDVGVFSIPYDGRWAALESRCGYVYDGRTRPDPRTVGFVSWEHHEAHYQLDLACKIAGEKYRRPYLNPSIGWPAFVGRDMAHTVYLGIGRKRDAAGFWEKKHWGDENYTRLVQMILENTDCDVVCTGNRMDLVTTGAYLNRRVRQRFDSAGAPRFVFSEASIKTTMHVMERCGSFIGNDTGTMHLAAAMGLPIVSVFNLEGTMKKNHPLSDPSSWRVLEGHERPVTVEEVYNAWMEVRR